MTRRWLKVVSPLLLEARRLPVLDDPLVTDGKHVAHIATHAQQRLVVGLPEEDTRLVVA
jgi:hypothetical protein